MIVLCLSDLNIHISAINNKIVFKFNFPYFVCLLLFSSSLTADINTKSSLN